MEQSALIWRHLPGRRKPMATERKDQGRAQDRRKVAGGQDHEVRYEAEKMDVSKDKVREAVKSEGNSRDKVERKLND
jgi:hypothetical protein